MITLIHRLQRRLFGSGPSWPGEADANAPRDEYFGHRLRAGGAARLTLPETRGGHIGPEPLVRIPFRLAPGDGEVRVAVFADPPDLVAIEVEKPDGTLLSGDGEQGLSLDRLDASTWCAFRLADDGEAGEWHLVLRVDTQRFKAYLLGVRQRFPREFARLAAQGVCYSVSVLASRRPALAARLPSGSGPYRAEDGPMPPPRPEPWAAAHPGL